MVSVATMGLPVNVTGMPCVAPMLSIAAAIWAGWYSVDVPSFWRIAAAIAV